jgi:hypothetical protein
MGRSAHTRRARLGRPAPAGQALAGARWLYCFASQLDGAQDLGIYPLSAHRGPQGLKGGDMRKYLLITAALAGTVMALAAPSVSSAATLPTPTRIVLFTGGGDATPVGPAIQPAGKWTVSAAPAKITTTNDGTLVENTSLGPIGACAAQCGEWWFDPRPGAVQLLESYWDQTNGQQVLATNLVPALANNNEWASLGGGTYTPLCLSWVVTASNNTYTLHYIKLSLTTYDWSEISAAELSTC